MHELIWLSKTEEETRRCGYLFAENCRGNVVVLLNGALGAGKTVFVRGLASGFGVEQEISSPSFNLMNIYSGSRHKLFHIDAFREKFLTWGALNLDDIIVEPFCCAVEWPEHFFEYPEDLAKFYVTIEPSNECRLITIKTQDKNLLFQLSVKD
ncbi:MAG: tRNA (adenosine(37)-N6)-threonylcarbamoyltransferase complex ATPase subunit type 1 TsaE [Puniceicoccales bacterium]|jgi:tRNA threonylcarbamoyladenosine biosynthesis protein TsaE|nr:tRNA (adenosine(37)-N6)-threonylcarbamoyltransferase complex ATPase subunit type 1 TsaE [Puniceicoccales bacterium]